MSFQRGDVVLAILPFVTRPGSKLRPVLVIQNDANNARMQNTIVAFITTNLSRSHLPSQVLIEVNTPAGRQSGLIADSVVTCENLITIRQSQARHIGRLPPDVMQKVDAALNCRWRSRSRQASPKSSSRCTIRGGSASMNSSNACR